MSDDFTSFSEWIPSGESLEGLEDKDFELSVEEIGSTSTAEQAEPCGGCTGCASGSHFMGVDFDNKEAALDVVEIKFKANRSGFYINETGIGLRLDSWVIVEVERGTDLGVIVTIGEEAHRKRRSRGIVGQPMGRILRVADEENLKQLADNRRTEKSAAVVFKEKCVKHNLQMKLTSVEFQIDRSRMTFYFTADRRIDFRALVRDLASIYHTRIELRQIGVRDEAKKVGGVGLCGREVCCVTWMTRLQKVNVEYARYQNLSLNPSRLAGACGRLKCCILFENRNYLESLENFPRLNSKLITPKGNCSVEKIDIFNDIILLKYQDTGAVESVGLNELKPYLPARGVSAEAVQIQNH